jgi:predicted nucleic acid-binding protein
MIVVDTNVIVYGASRGDRDALGHQAAAVLRRDREWGAPPLWRSEFCNAMALQVRYDGMQPTDASQSLRDAVGLVGNREMAVDGEAVIELSVDSGCTAYDCEFVVLARTLGVPLVTTDKQVLKAFPGIAVSLADFARGSK